MDLFDPLYSTILERGIIGIRDAAEQGDLSRCRAEAEHIHNIPSLIGEHNVNRHLYYATREREAYIEWVLSTGRKELRYRVLLAFARAWQQMDAILGLHGMLYEERLSEDSEKRG